MATDVEGEILCAWCGQALDEEGVELFNSAGGCDTCDYGSESSVEIMCYNPECPKYKKIIYKKEIS